MHSRSWRVNAVAAVLVAIQLSVSALATIGMCVNRPHTHGGVPAPDCVMHDGQSGGTSPESSHQRHHQHGNSTPADTAQVTCSCSADPITLLTTDIAVAPGIIVNLLPNLPTPRPSGRTQAVSDVRLAPLSPPPRITLS